MRKLVLGSIPNDYSPQTHIVLGPWCFLGKEHIYSEWESLDYPPDPFETPEDLAFYSNKICIYANYLIGGLTQKLNLYNNTSYSGKFWRILLMPWLLTLLQTTLERQIRINWIIEKYSEEVLTVELIKDRIQWNFRDTEDFINKGVLNNTYNWWLFSRLIEVQIPSKWHIKWVSIDIYSINIDNRKNNIKAEFSKLKKILVNKSAPFCRGVYGINLIQASILSLILSNKFIAEKCINEDQNDIDEDIFWNNQHTTLIKNTIPLCYKNILPKTITIKLARFILLVHYYGIVRPKNTN